MPLAEPLAMLYRLALKPHEILFSHQFLPSLLILHPSLHITQCYLAVSSAFVESRHSPCSGCLQNLQVIAFYTISS